MLLNPLSIVQLGRLNKAGYARPWPFYPRATSLCAGQRAFHKQIADAHRWQYLPPRPWGPGVANTAFRPTKVFWIHIHFRAHALTASVLGHALHMAGNQMDHIKVWPASLYCYRDWSRSLQSGLPTRNIIEPKFSSPNQLVCLLLKIRTIAGMAIITHTVLINVNGYASL